MYLAVKATTLGELTHRIAVITPFKISQVHRLWYEWKARIALLLGNDTYLHRTSHRFSVIAEY